MLCIDRLSLRLPAGFEQRAADIARLVGDALAQLDPPRAGAIERVRVGNIHVSAADSDLSVARSIAAGIADGMRSAR